MKTETKGGGSKAREEEDAMRRNKERSEKKTRKPSEVTFSHQVGHDVMVAFDMFPDTDNLQGGGAELNVNLTGLQHSIR